MPEKRFEIREGSLEYIQSKASLYEDIISITPIEHYPLLKLCVKDGYDEDKIMEFIDNYIPFGYRVHLSLERDCDNSNEFYK